VRYDRTCEYIDRNGETNGDLPNLPVKPVLAILVGVVVLGLLVFCLNQSITKMDTQRGR
jgi:hypothetical protein